MSKLIKQPMIRLHELAVSKKNSMVGGPFGSNLVSADYVSEGVPVVRGANLPMNARFSFENSVFVTENKAESLKANLAEAGDLVFTQRGTLGQVGILPADEKHKKFLISQSQMKMSVDTNKADPIYLYYYFRLPSTVVYIENHALQSGVPHINLGILRKFEVPCPVLAIQKKIAAVLSAYDELIENNTQRIALLEKMAEEIYREWFVRLRFPGHQKTKFYKGIPEAWDKALSSKYFGHIKGKSYTGNELSDDPINMPFVTLKSFNRGGGYRKDGLKYYSGKYNSNQVVYQNDVVMAVTDMTQNREVVGRVARIPDLGAKGAVISLDVIKMVPKKISSSFLYSYLRFSGFGSFIKEFANGANVLHLKPDLVGAQTIIMPTQNLQDAYTALAEPIYNEVDIIAAVLEPLKQTRDRLLTRLISGKLSVEDLEIEFPPSMKE